jgi:hypothetical protein
MSSEQWVIFWATVIATATASFALLAVRVAIGGARDIRTMLRRIEKSAATAQEDPRTLPPP